MSNSKRVIKNTIFLYIRMAVSILTNVFTTNILLRALGASDYGLYNVVGGAVAILGFLTATMSHTTQRFLNYSEGEGDLEKTKGVFNNSLIIHYTIAILFTVLLSLAGLLYFNGILNIPAGRETAAMVVYGSLIFSTAFSVTIVPYDAILNAHENMRTYSLIGIVDVIFKLLVAISILYINSDKLILYAILMAIESWLIRYITKFYCQRKYLECKKEELRRYFDKCTIREIASFAGWNLVNIASGMSSQYGKNIAVNHFFGTIFNAALGIATQLSGVVMGISANMIKAITPILVKSEASNQHNKMLEITYLGCRFSYLLFSFFCIPILFFTNDILELWLGDVPVGTSIFCKLLIIALLTEQLVSFLYQSIAAQGNIKNYNITRSIINIMPLISTVVMFCYGFSPYWAIINWIIWYSIGGGIVNLYFSNKNIGLSYKRYMTTVIIPCSLVTILSIIINILIMKLHKEYEVPSIMCFLLSIISSAPFYWLFGLNKLEKRKLLSLK